MVGRTIRIYGEAHTVIGVAPPEYAATRFAPQLWIPLVFSPQQRANYGSHSFTVIAKLKPGVSLTAAQADLEVTKPGLPLAQVTDEHHGRRVEVVGDNVQIAVVVEVKDHRRT